jgi:HAE1 family hydrophobic/amphiphilic exporter-1
MAKKFTSYLSELKFDPKLWNSLQAKYMVNFRLVLLLIISIIAIGTVSFFAIPRRLNPEIKLTIVTVTTVLPGSNPGDVESLVTVPLENKLRGVRRLDTITSTSTEGVSSIVMQFISGTDQDKARSDVQSTVDTVSLPTEAKTPTVKALDFEDQPVWDFAVVGNGNDASLMRFSKLLKKRIEDSSKVDRVLTAGYNTQEIQVLIDPLKIKEYNINPLTLSQLITKATQSYPAGTIRTSASSFALSINTDVTTVDDIRNLKITIQNQSLNLSDIATIRETAQTNQPQTFYTSTFTQPKHAVEFFVYKTASSNIDTAEADVKKIVQNTIKEYNGRFQTVTILNTAESISTQFSELIDEFRSTIILVFINLFIFLGLRQASIASLTVPLTFMSAIAVVNLLGLSLNFLTLFAFLLALGLLIDDTIVTVAAMTRYYASGKFTPGETGVLVWRDFIVPLWSTTITTIWAFVPLLISTGIIGEFIKPLPIVVTATLLSSTSIAVLITLPLMIVTLKPNVPRRVAILLKILGTISVFAAVYFLLPKSALTPITMISFTLFFILVLIIRRALMNNARLYADKAPTSKKILNFFAYTASNGLINLEQVSHVYMRVIDRILQSRWARRWTIAAIVIFAIVAYALIPLGFVKNEFFPKTDQDIVYMTLDLPAGTTIEKTNAETLRILHELRNTEGVNFIVAETGSQLGANLNRAANSASSIITFHLPKKDVRKISSIDLSQRLRDKYKTYALGTLTTREVSGGPPAGADIQIKLLGDDLSVLDTYANKIVDHLKTQPGIISAEKSIKPGTGKIVFVPDKSKIAEAGVSVDAVGLWLRTYASGFTLDTLKEGTNETDIIFRMGAQTMTPEGLGSIVIPTQNGGIPLISLGSLRLEANPTVITREGGKRSISVSAGVVAGQPIPEKNRELETFATQKLNLPPGYTWQTGGVNEENQKSVTSIFQAMGLSFLLILVTMVIEFNSYRQALITLLTIPLAIPGVFYIFALTGTPLSFPALIGVLALFGIVVTNAIVVVEKINDNRKHGMNLHDAVVDASGSRLEPILLTSLTSILGLIPITITNPLWRGLGGAIISGLLFSGLIKLFFVPVMYYIWYHED